MRSSSRAAFERLGPIRDAGPVRSGSKEAVVLRKGDGDGDVRSIDATQALALCGVSLLKAKRAVEAALDGGEAALILPAVPSRDDLVRDLDVAGFRLTVTTAPVTVDVRAIRERLSLTQEQFAVHYGLDLKTVQNWESGARRPDAGMSSYLRAISAVPEVVKVTRIAG